ncbi:hypothetical protein HK097_003084, partial [Rhizophlyctis rosea]
MRPLSEYADKKTKKSLVLVDYSSESEEEDGVAGKKFCFQKLTHHEEHQWNQYPSPPAKPVPSLASQFLRQTLIPDPVDVFNGS